MKEKDKTKEQLVGELMKERDEELQNTRKELQRILDLSVDIIAVADLKTGFFTKVNPAFSRIIGYSQEEILNTPFMDFVHPNDRNNTVDVVEDELASDNFIQHFENRYRCKDGSYKWIGWTSQPNHEKGITYATGRDITKKKQMELELESHRQHLESLVDERTAELKLANEKMAREITERRKAEEEIAQFKAIIDNAGYGVVINLLDGTLTYVNESFADMHGYKQKELVGQHYSALYTKEQLVTINKLRDQLMRTGSFVGEEIWHKNKNGNTFPTLMTGRLMKDDKGNPSYTVGTTIDITEQKRIEEEVIRNRDYLERLNDTLPQVIINVKYPERTIVYVNRAMEIVFGYTPEECIGENIEFLFADRKEYLRAGKVAEDAFSLGESFMQREYLYKRKNGEVFPAEVSGTFTGENGKITGSVGVVSDIAKRKKAEESLRESEEKFSRAFHSSPHSMSIVTLKEGRYVDVNDSYVQTFGYSREELLGRTTSDVGIAKADGFHKRLLQLEKDKMLREREANFYTKSGSKVDVLISTSIMEIGNQTCLLSVITDITERKMAEESARESEERYRALVDLGASFNEAIFLVQDTEQGTAIHVYANEEWSRITGYSNEELIGTPLLNIVHPKYREEVLDRYERRLKGKALPLTHELSIIRKDGFEVPVETVGGFTSYRGKPATVGFFRDITERKRAGEALKESELWYRSAELVGSFGHYSRYLDTNRLIWSEGTYRLFGVDPNKWVLTRDIVLNVIHPQDLKRWVMANQQLERGTKKYDIEFRIIRPDGEERVIHSVANILSDDAGKPERIFGTVVDITERKQAENKLAESHEALRNLSAHQQTIREEERTNVAREIHDELGQSLTALKMDLFWLTKRLPADGAPLLEKTASMLKLVDNTIGTVKRIAARLRPGILDDLGLIAALEWQAGELQEHTGIKCRLDFPPELPDTDKECTTMFFRIFQEALTNIARHSKATRVKISLREKANRLTLKIKDNGIGITEQQINNPRSFGLIGIRERIYSYGGKISIRGNEGKGTVIKVSCQLSRKEKEHDKNTNR